MPKLKRAQRKTSRSGPYPETLNKVPSTTHTTVSHGCTTFPFLDLPFELRLIVYANLLRMTPYYLPSLHLPLTSFPDLAQLQAGMAALQRSEVDHRATSKTRKSLNLVCHQISAEWSPLFYETTTAIVHASKRKLGYFKPKHMVLDQCCNPWHFANDFLRILQPAKLASLKRIAYEVRPGDFDSFDDFPKLLMKHIDRLPSLEKLSLYSPTMAWTDHGFVRLGDHSIDLWRRSICHLKWENLEERFLGLGKRNQTLCAKRQGAGVLQGWNITREMRVKNTYPGETILTVRGVAIVFKKGGPATTEDQPPSIKVLFKG
jgi:hypothetical protein